MDKEILQGFATRVAQANKSELVVVIYEAALASIEEGKKYLQDGNVDEARHEIKRAEGMLDELMRSLDMQYTIAHYLRQLYIYAYRELCQGIATRDASLFDHSTDVLKGLLPSFQELAKQDTSAPIMENTQQIYAGLTYGRGTLNETMAIDAGGNRGFEA